MPHCQPLKTNVFPGGRGMEGELGGLCWKRDAGRQALFIWTLLTPHCDLLFRWQVSTGCLQRWITAIPLEDSTSDLRDNELFANHRVPVCTPLAFWQMVILACLVRQVPRDGLPWQYLSYFLELVNTSAATEIGCSKCLNSNCQQFPWTVLFPGVQTVIMELSRSLQLDTLEMKRSLSGNDQT